MAKPIWFPFYPNDFLASTKVSLMDTCEIGAYLLLLCHEWASPDCSLPTDEEQLKRLARYSGDFSRIRACFIEKRGKLFNVRLVSEWEKANHQKDLARDAANKRWHSGSNASALPTQCSSPSPSPSPSPSQRNRRTKEPSSSDLENTQIAARSALTVDQVVDLWNSIPGLPKAERVSGPIERSIKLRIKEHPTVDWFHEVFQRVSRSDFLTGRKTDFTATIDWVLGPKNLAKVLNGNYDNREKMSGKDPNGFLAGMQAFLERGNDDEA